MFKFISHRANIARFSAMLSALLLFAALLLMLWPFSGYSSLTSLKTLLEILTILALMFLSFTAVIRRIGMINFGVRKATIIVAFLDLIAGYIYAGEFVVFAGIAMFIAWLLLSV